MKTFVAPCVGGPLAGKLKWFEMGIERFTVPVVPSGGALVYELKTKPNKEREWHYIDDGQAYTVIGS